MTRAAVPGLEPSSHIERVSRYCALIAGVFGLDAEKVRLASRLHDVGMLAAAGPIADIPGPLTARERSDMLRHTWIGHALLAGSGDPMLDCAAEIALRHHERFDGGGYPEGLAGASIPLSARIVAVADTFDALTTARPYRQAGTVEQALATLREERGRQLDPDVVDAFLAERERVLDIHERHPPEERASGDQEPTYLTVQEAAAMLGASTSQVRRWSNEGRIATVRTAGGHRRFPLDAVIAFARARGVRPAVRAVDPPTIPLTLLAEQLRRHGPELVATAASAIYRDGPRGWFASPAAAGELQAWLDELAASCTTGRYERALAASDALMRDAHAHAATRLERHMFIERFGRAAVRALARAHAEPHELACARRLFSSLLQTLLDADYHPVRLNGAGPELTIADELSGRR